MLMGVLGAAAEVLGADGCPSWRISTTTILARVVVWKTRRAVALLPPHDTPQGHCITAVNNARLSGVDDSVRLNCICITWRRFDITCMLIQEDTVCSEIHRAVQVHGQRSRSLSTTVSGLMRCSCQTSAQASPCTSFSILFVRIASWLLVLRHQVPVGRLRLRHFVVLAVQLEQAFSQHLQTKSNLISLPQRGTATSRSHAPCS